MKNENMYKTFQKTPLKNNLLGTGYWWKKSIILTTLPFIETTEKPTNLNTLTDYWIPASFSSCIIVYNIRFHTSSKVHLAVSIYFFTFLYELLKIPLSPLSENTSSTMSSPSIKSPLSIYFLLPGGPQDYPPLLHRWGTRLRYSPFIVQVPSR